MIPTNITKVFTSIKQYRQILGESLVWSSYFDQSFWFSRLTIKSGLIWECNGPRTLAWAAQNCVRKSKIQFDTDHVNCNEWKTPSSDGQWAGFWSPCPPFEHRQLFHLSVCGAFTCICSYCANNFVSFVSQSKNCHLLVSNWETRHSVMSCLILLLHASNGRGTSRVCWEMEGIRQIRRWNLKWFATTCNVTRSSAVMSRAKNQKFHTDNFITNEFSYSRKNISVSQTIDELDVDTAHQSPYRQV